MAKSEFKDMQERLERLEIEFKRFKKDYENTINNIDEENLSEDLLEKINKTE